MRTRSSQYYQSPTHSKAGSEEETIDVPKKYVTVISRDSSKAPKTWEVSIFDIMVERLHLQGIVIRVRLRGLPL